MKKIHWSSQKMYTTSMWLRDKNITGRGAGHNIGQGELIGVS